MGSHGAKERHLKELVEESQFWDVEDLMRNFDREMAQLEQGLGHMIWDVESRCVTAPLSPLPMTPKFKVTEDESELKLEVRLPGISRENLRLNVDSKSIVILACSGDVVCRPYYLRVDASGEIVPDSAEAALSGETLDVRVAKAKKKRLKVK